MVEHIAIDRGRIVGDTEVPEEYFCSICYCLLWKPRSCAGCQQLFCEKCIQTWLRTSPTRPCRCPNYQDQRCPPFVLSILSRLKIRCRYESLGCRLSIPYEQLEQHEQSGCTIDTSKSNVRGESPVRETNSQLGSAWIYLRRAVSGLSSAPIRYIFFVYLLMYVFLTFLIQRTSLFTLLLLISLLFLLRMFSINAFNGLRTSQLLRQFGRLLLRSLGTTLAILLWIHLAPYYITAIVLLLLSFYTRLRSSLEKIRL